ncbi:MAG: hypothetical protein SF172_18705 [Burkholderiales bacterium]|nr:hypothetical protein [Burkholderiales bacterium]
MKTPSTQTRHIVESIYTALISARNSRQLVVPLPAVEVSLNPSGSVLVHLLPIGIFGPYLRKQIPHALLADVKRLTGLSASHGRTKSVPPESVPAPQSLADLLLTSAGATGRSPAVEEPEPTLQRVRKPIRPRGPLTTRI